MLSIINKKSVFLLITSLISILCGFFVTLFPTLFVVSLILLVIYIFVVYQFNVTGVFLFIVLSILSPDLKIADVLFFITVIVLLISNYRPSVQRPHEQRLHLDRLIFISLITFFGFLIVSTLIGKIVLKHQWSYLYNDFRQLIYYVWIPVFIWLRHKNHYFTVIKINRLILAVALFIAVTALFQFFSGIQVVAQGRVGYLLTEGADQSDITRVQLPGFVFVMYAIIFAIFQLFETKANKLLWLAFLTLMLVAEYVNFGRALWLWTLISFVLILFFIHKKMLYVTMLCAALTTSTLGLWMISPDKLDTIQTRLVSIKSEGGARTSYGWRKIENEYALKRIQASPVLGVAIGGEYRPWMREISKFKDHTRYIHNSYLFIATKTGLLSLMALLTIIVAIWYKNIKSLKSEVDLKADHYPRNTIAVFLPSILGLSLTQPELVNPYGAFLISCIVSMTLFYKKALNDKNN
ncbi:O-antigen ligase family protein [Methylophilus aquaticus]|uniref:O-antigen ligase-related domain-containing protein n=1 Tax=Methylophilus aquaticus TaxID=1971610 RepID=A0ABT9JT86_9PROT|nr:hypothetical protein [Methylophilus aquaticus]MDP8567780.1 hypothetical protein [Methylophilus aquaticus]